jgi:hypothetical protein
MHLFPNEAIRVWWGLALPVATRWYEGTYAECKVRMGRGGLKNTVFCRNHGIEEEVRAIHTSAPPHTDIKARKDEFSTWIMGPLYLAASLRK